MSEANEAIARILGDVLEKLQAANSMAEKSGQVNVQRGIEHMRGHLEVVLASVDSFPSGSGERRRQGTDSAEEKKPTRPS